MIIQRNDGMQELCEDSDHSHCAGPSLLAGRPWSQPQ